MYSGRSRCHAIVGLGLVTNKRAARVSDPLDLRGTETSGPIGARNQVIAYELLKQSLGVQPDYTTSRRDAGVSTAKTGFEPATS